MIIPSNLNETNNTSQSSKQTEYDVVTKVKLDILDNM